MFSPDPESHAIILQHYGDWHAVSVVWQQDGETSGLDPCSGRAGRRGLGLANTGSLALMMVDQAPSQQVGIGGHPALSPFHAYFLHRNSGRPGFLPRVFARTARTEPSLLTCHHD